MVFRKFFVRIFAVLLVVSLFWSLAVYLFFEYESAKKVDTMIKHATLEYKTLFKEERLESLLENGEFKKALEAKMEAQNISKLAMYNESGVELYSYGGKLSESTKRVFDSLSSVRYVLIPSIESASYHLVFRDAINIGSRHIIVKGVFKLSKESAEALKSGVGIVLFVIFMTVFLNSAVLFPLFYMQYRALQIERCNLTRSNFNLLSVLGNAIALKDSDTDEHNYRVVLYSIFLGECLKLPKSTMRSLIQGAFLHDVGKIGIPESVLLKPAKLNEEEFGVMKRHVDLGLEIIKEVKWLDDAKNIIAFHHEKVDGSGYPQGLASDTIPLIARVFAIVDVFDALTSKRPYKEPFAFNKAVAILQEGRGSHFDAVMLDIFTERIEQFYLKIHALPKEQLMDLSAQKAKEYFDFC